MFRITLALLLAISCGALANDASLQGVWQISSTAYDDEIIEWIMAR